MGLEVAYKIAELSLHSPRETLELHINSNGGFVAPALVIYHALGLSISPTRGFVAGEALSVACMILQGCRHRVARRDAHIHFHSPYLRPDIIIHPHTDGSELVQWFSEQVPLGIAHLQVTKALMADIIRKRTGREQEEILSVMDGVKRVFSAQEALEFGLIDEIV